MNTATRLLQSEAETQKFAQKFAAKLKGGEVIELVGDVGAGKTTFVKGLAKGLGVKETVGSPSFTIFGCYHAANGRSLHHYDFYRLENPGVVAYDLVESLANLSAVTVIEWGDTVNRILPFRRTAIRFTSLSETGRKLTIENLPR